MAKTTLTVKCRMNNSTEKNSVIQFFIPAPNQPKAKPGQPAQQLAKTVIMVNTTDKAYAKQFEPGQEYKITIE